MRKTKIVVTVGRLYNDEETLHGFIQRGADILRTNLSHQTQEWHADLLKRIRKVIAESGKDIKILADISGPKVRTGPNPEGQYFIELKKGDTVVLSPEEMEGAIQVRYPEFLDLVGIGSVIYIDDAGVQLTVKEKTEKNVSCDVLFDCKLGGQRTVIVPGKEYNLPTVTEKDWNDLEFLSKEQPDYLGFSFVKTADEVRRIRQFFDERGCSTKICSKIETPEGVKNMKEIIQVSDWIMIARGDMGVFFPLEQVPRIQYDLIRACNEAGTFVITATEMLNSMKNSNRPTRAEVNDVYSSIIAGTDAVMLSGETTEGNFPLESVEYIHRVVEEAEKSIVRQ